MQRLDLGGIPLFHETGPEPGFVNIQFRSGAADERLPLRGISHLVEHLTMFAVGDRDHFVNAYIGSTATQFFAAGTQQELERFANDVMAALTDLPWGRLEAEREVLITESMDHEPAWFERMLTCRYGLRGFGAVLAPEVGLRRLDRQLVESWVRERFNRSNATIWMHSPKPLTSLPPLPEGSRFPLPPAESIAGYELPAAHADGVGGASLSMLMPRDWRTTATMSIACKRVRDKLRMRDGIVYEVLSHYQRISLDQAFMGFGAACRESHYDVVVPYLLEVVNDLATNGPTEEECSRYVELNRRGIDEDEYPQRTTLDAAALYEIIGDDSDPSDPLNGIEHATPVEIRDAVAEAMPSLLMLIPGDCEPPGDLPQLARGLGPMDGMKFKFDVAFSAKELIVGEDSAYLFDGDEWFAIPPGEVELVMRTAGGTYTLVGLDETTITINPTQLKQPDEAEAQLIRLAGGELVPDPDSRDDDLLGMIAQKLTKSWLIEEELGMLPHLLDHDEQLVTMSRAEHGVKYGLLVLTDKRLLFISKSTKKETILRMARTSIDSVKVAGVLGKALTIYVEGDKLKFSGFAPKARLDEFARAFD